MFIEILELANVKSNNVIFHSDFVVLHLDKSKTDVYRECKDVVISATNNSMCPVAKLSRYLTLAAIPGISNEFIFRSEFFF